MFTGIITAIGTITQTRALGAAPEFGLRLSIAAPAGYLASTALGDSIALNGACMTVAGLDAAASRFEVDVSGESLSRTCALDRPGRVNLELALRAGDRLGGHLVSGHVDGIGSIEQMRAAGESTEMVVLCPAELARFIAVKGSLVVNGVSLTVNRVDDRRDGCGVSINLIPHTLSHTTLGELGAGSRVNLEIDLIARYVERLVSAPKIQAR
jgi:riboflavin synthase